MKQSVAPKRSIREALKVAQAIKNKCGGSPTEPLIVGQAMGLIPTGRVFADLCGASIAYGFTEGGSQAELIKLTTLGLRAISEQRNDRDSALREAIMIPTAIGGFLRRYNGSQMPKDNVALRMLETDAELSPEKAEELLPLIRDNAEFVGLLQDIEGKQFVHLGAVSDRPESISDTQTQSEDPPPSHSQPSKELPASAEANNTKVAGGSINRRVFITHGSNTKIVEQIKELVEVANFDPVVAVEQETSAMPIPHKIREGMRDCKAGIIHVGPEQRLTDNDGNEHVILNSNVLIEIGAAMALYADNFVLLVEKGVDLPSNLQGLSVIQYQGDNMDGDTAIRLLKSFRNL